MPQAILTLLDVRRVQPYIFGTNELKQNLGASALVEAATRAWVLAALDAVPLSHNTVTADEIKSDKAVWRGEVLAEVLFAGGGNVGLLFATLEHARAFTEHYTAQVLQKAPGLEVAVVHGAVGGAQDRDLATGWANFQRELAQRKERPAPRQAPLGLSVTAQCAYTSRFAVAEVGEDPGAQVLASAEVREKLRYHKLAQDRLRQLLPSLQHYELPSDFDHLGGERGRFRYLAVVHADGNGIGRRLEDYLKPSTSNAEWVDRLRRFSQALNQAGLQAMQAVGALLVEHVHQQGKRTEIIGRQRAEDVIELRENRLPFRPIVYGGDDVTFVCDGRLGLALAVKFLETFNRQPLPDGEVGYACAGVAIVHTHYPFAQAYALAAKLCQEAKNFVQAHEPNKHGQALSWHFATSGLLGDWAEIRQREYTALPGANQAAPLPGHLAMRPVFLRPLPGAESWRTWDNFKRLTEAFRQGAAWRGRRNKVKDLRTALRQGETAGLEFTRLYGRLPEPEQITGVDNVARVARTGWHQGRCVYFDAVEAADFLMLLE